MTLNLASLPCIPGQWRRVRGIDGGTTDAEGTSRLSVWWGEAEDVAGQGISVDVV